MGTVIMETAHTGKCATPLASMNSEYAYAGPRPVSSGVERRTSGRTRGGRTRAPAADAATGPVRVRGTGYVVGNREAMNKQMMGCEI
jgi:hypothetical protein